MFRTPLLAAIALAIAFGGGVSSAWYAIQAFEGVGVLAIGPWTAYPDAGTERADPYWRARAARKPAFPLGAGEGLAFVANEDSNGARLDRRCNYAVEGHAPPTRLWTLYPADAALAPVGNAVGRANAMHSMRLLRKADGSFAIGVGPRPQGGNWQPIAGDGPFSLVFTLYDTPAAASSSIADLALPAIKRITCDE